MKKLTSRGAHAEGGRTFVFLEILRTSLWPVPLAMIAAALLLFYGALQLDAATSARSPWLGATWLYRGEAEDALQLLSTLVTGIITMASIVFSITIMTLTLAANQFGSRLVPTYMSDLRTKLALGLFAMTTVYGLLGMRLVERSMAPAEVPHIVVSLGLVLGLACVLTLLFFLHQVARSIVADQVIARVVRDLDESIDRLPPLEADSYAKTGDAPPGPAAGPGFILPARQEGYIQSIEHGPLVELLSRHDLVLSLNSRAGTFMCVGGWLGTIQPGPALQHEVVEGIRKRIVIGDVRTASQDLEFSIRQLIDVALRALSPGINDANTAVVVVDRLQGALSRLMGKALPPGVHRDHAGVPRLTSPVYGYAEVLKMAFNQIRHSAAPQPHVILTLLKAIHRIGEHVRVVEQRDALLAEVELIAAAGLKQSPNERDRGDIEQALADARQRLAQALMPQPTVEERPA
jgi:uncharacterized membrane protein